MGRPVQTYDALDRLSTVTDALNHVTTSVYDAVDELIATIDARGNTTSYLYDSAGRQIAVVDPLGNRTTTVYDGLGQTVGQINADGIASYTVYDALGRAVATIDALGNITQTVYDSVGNVVNTIDADNHKTTSVYDAANRLTVSIDPLSNRTTYTLDAAGNQVTIQDARGNTVTQVFDAVNRVIAVTDALNHTASTVFDKAGNVIATVDASANATSYGFDADERQVTVTEAAGGTATTVYDAVSNVVNTIDGMGNKTTMVYDAVNQLVQSINADGKTTSYQYDANGNQTQVIDPDGNITTMTFDAANRQTVLTDPLGTVTSVFDAAGQNVEKIDRLGRAISYYYDPAGRQIGELWRSPTSADTDRQAFTYDAAGNMLTASDFAGAYTFTYNADNEVATQTDPLGNLMTYSYDANNNVTKLQDSLGGTTNVTTYVYDNANRETSVQFSGNSQNLRQDTAYTNADQVQSLTRFSNLAGTTVVGSASYTYDSSERVTNIHDYGTTTATNLTNVSYTYDNADRLTSQTRDGTTNTYVYDSASQVTADGTNTLTYDSNGSRNSGSYTVGTDNEITNDGTWTYSYDTQGQMTEKSQGASSTTWLYTYNDIGQMLTANEYSKASGGTLLLSASYTYDAFGDLIKEAVTQSGTTTTTQTLYRITDMEPGIVNSVNQAWADLDGSGNLLYRYVFSGDSATPIARLNSTTLNWLWADREGSVILISDNSATVLKAVTYDAFGNSSSLAGSGTLGAIQFQGMRFDSTTGQYIAHWRVYYPATGQWDEVDPQGFGAGDPNSRRFVGNNGANGTDPSGLVVIFVHGVVGFGPWSDPLYNSMNNQWKKEKQTPQIGFHFKWTDEDGGTPRLIDAQASLKIIRELAKNKLLRGDRNNIIAINDLTDFIQKLRQILPEKEPIYIVSHSQGTIITVGAIQDLKGAVVNGALLLNSPLRVKEAKSEIDKALLNSLEIINVFSEKDKVVRLVNQAGVTDVKLSNAFLDLPHGYKKERGTFYSFDITDFAPDHMDKKCANIPMFGPTYAHQFKSGENTVDLALDAKFQAELEKLLKGFPKITVITRREVDNLSEPIEGFPTKRIIKK
jgi:RHS repeat-associated protein